MLRVDVHVFPLEDAARTAVGQALLDRRLRKIRPAYFAGGIAAAIEKYRSEDSPRLLIVETGESPTLIFDYLERLSSTCQSGTELILLGHLNDVGLYRQLTKQGVREYIPMPADPANLIEAILSVGVSPEEPRQGRLISFIGASGGVGSSTLASNVAWHLGKLYDDETALVDLDLAFGTVGLDFNLESPQTSAQALAQAGSLDDQMLERFLARHNDNLVLLTSAGDGSATADIDIAALDQLIKTLRANASWVIADLPRTWCGWVRHVLDASNEVVLTAVPTLGSLRNARSAAEALNAGRQNDAPVRVVLNRIGANPKTDIPIKDFAATLGAAPVVLVPNDSALFASAATAGRIAAEVTKGQRVHEPLARLANLVSGRRASARQARFSALAMLGGLFARSWSGLATGFR